MATRRVSALAVLAIVLPMMVSCAARGAGDTAAVDTSAAASPGSALAGTYEGMAWAVPGSAYYVSTPIQRTITSDDFFMWSRRGAAVPAQGPVRHAGPDRVILQEHQAQTAVQLKKVNP